MLVSIVCRFACFDNVGSFAEEDVGRHGVTSAVGSADASRGLEVAVANLQEYCNDTVKKEATTIMSVFPSPNEGMSILVQRVLEQRATTILDRLLIKPSLASLPPIEEGGLLQYLRVLAVAYDKTKELAKELQPVDCGDLDIEGLTESIYTLCRRYSSWYFGIVVDTKPDNFVVDIKGPNLAFLPVLAFESGTRRNIPKFKVLGSVIWRCIGLFVPEDAAAAL